jgi:hypothetical protein
MQIADILIIATNIVLLGAVITLLTKLWRA